MGLREQLEMLGVPVPPGMTDEELAAGLDMVSNPSPAIDGVPVRQFEMERTPDVGAQMGNLEGAPSEDIDVEPQVGMRYGVPVEELTPQEARRLERYKVRRAKQLAKDAGVSMEDAYQSLDNSAAVGGVNISPDGIFNIDDQRLVRQAAFGRAEEEQNRQAAVRARGPNMGAGMTRGQSDFFMTQLTPEQRELYKQSLVTSQRDRDMTARMQNAADLRAHEKDMAEGQADFIAGQAGLDREHEANVQLPSKERQAGIEAKGLRGTGAEAAGLTAQSAETVAGIEKERDIAVAKEQNKPQGISADTQAELDQQKEIERPTIFTAYEQDRTNGINSASNSGGLFGTGLFASDQYLSPEEVTSLATNLYNKYGKVLGMTQEEIEQDIYNDATVRGVRTKPPTSVLGINTYF